MLPARYLHGAGALACTCCVGSRSAPAARLASGGESRADARLGFRQNNARWV